MDMSQNEVSDIGSKIVTLREKNGHLILRHPHIIYNMHGSTYTYGSLHMDW